MRTRWLRSIFVVSLLLTATVSVAYVESTHDRITIAGANQSILVTNPDLLRSLGLRPDINAPIFPGASSSILQLLRTGVVAEDQGGRSIHHFFDPTRENAPNNGALVLFPITPFTLSSPSWALEDRRILNNDFSFRSARQYFHNALTNPTDSGRNLSFVRTFESLGHIVHHLQDMAQPQHVRNDDHCNVLACIPLLHRPSHFEKYVNSDAILDQVPQLVAGYAPVYDPSNPGPINTPRKFWYTGDGKGVAEFTNRNFVSARTNFRFENGVVLPDIRYGTPMPGASQPPYTLKEAYEKVFGPGTQVPTQIAEFCGTSTACEVEAFATSGTDLLTGQPVVNEFASSLSIFGPDLQLLLDNWPIGSDAYSNQTYKLEREFTLNRLNHRSALPHLLSRAVGYSAGMINYFFRGDIRIGPNPAAPTSAAILNYTREPISGTIKIYHEANDGRRELFKSIENVSLPAAGPTGPTSRSISMLEPEAFRKAKRPLQYTLVFTGDIGEERRTQTDIMGAVAGRQLAVVYAAPTISDWQYSANIDGLFGNIGSGEASVLATSVEAFRAHLRQTFPFPGCDAFTFTLPEWPVSSFPETVFHAGIEVGNQRSTFLEFPPSCSVLNGRSTLVEGRGRTVPCPADHMITARPIGLPEPTFAEACFALR